jgi:hypothetical protein
VLSSLSLPLFLLGREKNLPIFGFPYHSLSFVSLS